MSNTQSTKLARSVQSWSSNQQGADMAQSIPSISSSEAIVRSMKRDTTYVGQPAAKLAENSDDLFEIGDCLNGTYEIRAVLGKGGMGQVFEAHDRILNRTVAIKASWSHIAFGSLIQEARALAALNGRGVPAVFGMGQHRGVEFCVMERMYGKTLAAHMQNRLRRGMFDIDEVLEMMIGVADALAELHGSGLIHRDLKPANIMLAPRNRTVLLDLGLFLTQGRTGNEISLCGSPRYLAPEAITASIELGQCHLLDVYSLGIIGFILLTRRHPFQQTEPSKILWSHVHATPPKLSTLRQDVPWRLERLIDEMLAKDPKDRPFSADSIAAELSTIRAQLSPVLIM